MWIGSNPSQFIFDNLKEYSILNRGTGQVHFIYDSDPKFVTEEKNQAILKFAKNNNIDLIDLDKREFGDEFLKKIIYEYIDYKNNAKSYAYTKDWVTSYAISHFENSAYFDIDAKIFTSLAEMYKKRNAYGFFGHVSKYENIDKHKITNNHTALDQGIFVYNTNATKIFRMAYDCTKKLIEKKGWDSKKYFHKDKETTLYLEKDTKIMMQCIECKILIKNFYAEVGENVFSSIWTAPNTRIFKYFQIQNIFKNKNDIAKLAFPENSVKFLPIQMKSWLIEEEYKNVMSKFDKFIMKNAGNTNSKEILKELEEMKEILPKRTLQSIKFTHTIHQNPKYVNTEYTVYDKMPIQINYVATTEEYIYGAHFKEEPPSMVFIFSATIICLGIVLMKLHKNRKNRKFTH